MRRVGGYLLGCLVAVALFLVTGELLARTFGVIDRLDGDVVARFGGYTGQIFERGPSGDLPYRLRPGLETMLWDIPLRVNRLGFRGGEIEAVPAAGVQRTLLLGDSIVFGQGVREEETVAAVLERRLAEILPGAHEVVNAGVQGYDAVAEAALLEGAGAALRPAVVVVGMSLNDYDPAPGFHPAGVLIPRTMAELEPSLLEHSEFFLVLRWLSAFARGRLSTQVLAKAAPPPAKVALPPAKVALPPAKAAPPPPAGTAPTDPAAAYFAGLERWVAAEHLPFYANPDPVRWTRLGDALRRLRRSADDLGARLLVAIFPESFQVGVAVPDLRPQQRLLALCDEVGVRCLDLQPAFAAAGGPLFHDPQHPNARGHAVAAAAIAEALRDAPAPGVAF